MANNDSSKRTWISQNKQPFIDANAMRYDLKLKDVPKSCTCVKDYSIKNCLSCKNGALYTCSIILSETLFTKCYKKSAKMLNLSQCF